MTTETTQTTKRAIEEYFPIVEINRLAVPERTAFKPIYQMHKWFARRASCVFRAILLAAMKPVGADIMEEFYKDHTNDPDTNGKVILDPFMGGGTTVVEALRLGCKVIGIDLNPVAWFIVKTEVEPVDIDALRDAFERLANRRVDWRGRSVRDTLLEQYKTECPCCGAGREDAYIIYTFWVKSAICTSPTCKRQVPLFSDYIICNKAPSIRYWRDALCPKCGKSFDWEVEPAAFIAEPTLMVNNPLDAAGAGRGNKRWTFAPTPPVRCPWCQQEVTPQPQESKPLRKKVDLTVLLCPFCEAVWQYRGTVPERVSCPVCREEYAVTAERRVGYYDGDAKKFVCACGTKAGVLDSVRKWLAEDELLPARPYAIEGWCPRCGGNSEEEQDSDEDLFGEPKRRRGKKREPDHPFLLTKNNGKFFKRVTAADLARYQQACRTWEREKARLPYPKSKITEGYNTNQMINYNYRYWHQMFNPRQLLCLSTLLKAIDEEPDQTLKEMLLSSFMSTLNNTSDFCSYRPTVGALRQVFARHDFAPKGTPTENNVWGVRLGMGTFSTWSQAVIEGKAYGLEPWDYHVDKQEDRTTRDSVDGESTLYAINAMTLPPTGAVDFVVTDPPYAGNVNYSELSDYFYSWLRMVLAEAYPSFAPDETPKAEEIIENPTRGKTNDDFEQGLTAVFRESHGVLKDNGLLVFTFHHSQEWAWEALLRAVCNARFEMISVYPVHSESESSFQLMGKEAIAYDLIHVCRKRYAQATIEARSWAGIRQEVRRNARQEIERIEAGRYGREPLSPADVRIILIGKCLELYSRHYGAVVDHEGKAVELGTALEEIRMMVDQLVTREQPLPPELQDVDPESYVYLTALCGQREIKGDDVHKATRGIMEIDVLRNAGLIIKGRTGRGRTYEVRSPRERYNELCEKFGDAGAPVQSTLFGEEVSRNRGRVLFIDKMHLLMGVAEGGENLMPWLQRFRGDAPQIKAACEYLSERRKDWAPILKKILNLMDLGPLFRSER